MIVLVPSGRPGTITIVWMRVMWLRVAEAVCGDVSSRTSSLLIAAAAIHGKASSKASSIYPADALWLFVLLVIWTVLFLVIFMIVGVLSILPGTACCWLLLVVEGLFQFGLVFVAEGTVRAVWVGRRVG